MWRTSGPTTNGPTIGRTATACWFAIPEDVPQEILPQETGLIVADRYGAEVIRPVEERRLPAARRKAVILRFARASALRPAWTDGPGSRVGMSSPNVMHVFDTLLSGLMRGELFARSRS